MPPLPPRAPMHVLRHPPRPSLVGLLRPGPAQAVLAAAPHITAGQPARAGSALRLRMAGPTVPAPTSLRGRQIVTPTAGGARRGYVSRATLAALEGTPAGRAGIAAFRFQATANCVHDAGVAHERALQHLIDEGVLTRPPIPGLLRGMLLRVGPAASPAPHTAADFAAAVDRRGPAQLILHGILAPDQGGDVYTAHHSVVLLAAARQLGLLLDGNNLQRNPVMDALHAWRAPRGDSRPLHLLGPDDFAEFDRSPQAHHAGVRLHQAAFAVVDLEALACAPSKWHAARKPSAYDYDSIAPPPQRLDLLLQNRCVRVLRPMLGEAAEAALLREVHPGGESELPMRSQ
ncbi:hypothetical protein WG922_08330 [Ramlibacter sp. AN1015]|uniref:hypothetical protein n=1 Tax=Ramlibacter sp. AN1015 TaxID=3133428 RepID=UPI0030BDDB2C